MFLKRHAPALFILIMSCALVGPVEAQQALIEKLGKDEYDWHCATCDGANGMGDGEFAPMLIKPPSDLTALKEPREFPFWRVYRIISGQEKSPVHATFQMSKFWERFKADVGSRGSCLKKSGHLS